MAVAAPVNTVRLFMVWFVSFVTVVFQIFEVLRPDSAIEKAPMAGAGNLRESTEAPRGGSGLDSSPHRCDSLTDILPPASQMPCQGIRFGTHAFPARPRRPFYAR